MKSGSLWSAGLKRVRLLADSKVSSPDRFARLEQKTDDKQRRPMIIGDGISFMEAKKFRIRRPSSFFFSYSLPVIG
jgi:hypothetical protein